MKKINKGRILEELNSKYPEPVIELNYTKDYELLIAVMLSAQTTDKRVNSVTNVLFKRYPSLNDLDSASLNDIKKIIKPVGTFNRKAVYIKELVKDLINEYDSKVPKDRGSLESLSGVGRKTANVVSSVLFNVPSIAVDTHVKRVSKRLGFASVKDNEYQIEKKLMKAFDKKDWSKIHHQMVFFGRYHCKAVNPECKNCKLNDICKEKNKE